MGSKALDISGILLKDVISIVLSDSIVCYWTKRPSECLIDGGI
jgi:hypothetical protein